MIHQRHRAREFALQGLYQAEVTGGGDPAEFEALLNEVNPPKEARAFAHQLFEGTTQHKEEIDKILISNMEHWRLDRVSILTRNVMRMAVYEMFMLKILPQAIILDEALELSKDFVDEPSRAFINSVLQKVVNGAVENPEAL